MILIYLRCAPTPFHQNDVPTRETPEIKYFPELFNVIPFHKTEENIFRFYLLHLLLEMPDLIQRMLKIQLNSVARIMYV